jgi:hypothetical protein
LRVGGLAQRPLLIAGFAIAAVLAGIVWLASSSLETPCDNTVISELPSPDGSRKAVLFERSCGATTGFSSQVSILKPHETASTSGNALIVDTDHGAAPAGRWGGPPIDMQWTGARELLLSYDARTRVFEQKSKVGDVAIRYSASPVPTSSTP